MNSFFETIFLKKDSSLERKLDILKENPLANKYHIYMLETGIKGENQVVYHLNKSNLGMYVLRDINLVSNDLRAQIDFIVITTHHIYFIECKNYNSDIIHVDETRNFEISTKIGKRFVKKGIKSPLSQAEDQLSVFKRIYENDKNDLLNNLRLNEYFKTMVVFTNSENRLNISKAPYDIKYRILKVDNLIRQIEYDDNHFKGNRLTKQQMEFIAKYILSKNVIIKVEDVALQSEIDDNNINNEQIALKCPPLKQKSKSNNLKKKILITFFILFIIYIFNNIYENNNSKLKELTNNQIKAINTFKTAYENSKQNGFEIIHTSICKEMSNIFGNVTFDCDKLPLEINVINDTKMTIYKNYNCYTLETSNDGKNIISTNRETNGFVEMENCRGQYVGFLEWDENNEYYHKIGGYDKIREMATYAFVNNIVVDKYYDFNNIQNRGGNPNLQTMYKMNVDMFFSALTGKGYSIRGSSTNKEETNKMCESFYYIMK